MTINFDDYSSIPYYSKDLPNATHGDHNKIIVVRMKSSLGDLLVGATSKGLCLLLFIKSGCNYLLQSLIKLQGGDVIVGNSPYFSLLDQELREYFSGNLRNFSIPLDIYGTNYQKRAWNILLNIPYAETYTYQQQAVKAGHHKGVCAIVRANDYNKINIIIPCHRVIGKDGKMKKYTGGIWRKKYLLKLELGGLIASIKRREK